MIFTLNSSEITKAVLRYVVEEHFSDQNGEYNADVELSYDKSKGGFVAEVKNLKKDGK